MGFDNSRNHPLYLAHRAAEMRYLRAAAIHSATEYVSDLAAANAFRKVLYLQLQLNQAYIEILTSGLPVIEHA